MVNMLDSGRETRLLAGFPTRLCKILDRNNCFWPQRAWRSLLHGRRRFLLREGRRARGGRLLLEYGGIVTSALRYRCSDVGNHAWGRSWFSVHVGPRHVFSQPRGPRELYPIAPLVETKADDVTVG